MSPHGNMKSSAYSSCDFKLRSSWAVSFAYISICKSVQTTANENYTFRAATCVVPSVPDKTWRMQQIEAENMNLPDLHPYLNTATHMTAVGSTNCTCSCTNQSYSLKLCCIRAWNASPSTSCATEAAIVPPALSPATPTLLASLPPAHIHFLCCVKTPIKCSQYHVFARMRNCS